ncbi:TIR domain-containing protein [Turneriella parva]|uniref:Nucleotide-binding protein, TIR-like protein n=1 Tax=Turneriella parva (strain ATCC BAA-1111 / DSM 21527 / NCTC 11395 / H) TaxID=869212 RepID=I4BA92_TURPD|nr:nucleotide-binding protein [Turneriella parva]AFM14199.1 Nucleotide-binding protein, TIR-like protein [Turneriella parva DSM 21527]
MLEDDNDDEFEEEFKVFVSHGRSPLWNEVERFVRTQLEIDVVILKDQVNRGRTVIEKLEEETDECHYAIIVMTAEDEQADGTIRARQNVVHEIGFFQGKFGRENVLVLRQDSVEEFSNIAGIVYEPFSGNNIQSTFERIRSEIDDALERFLEEDEDEDEED